MLFKKHWRPKATASGTRAFVLPLTLLSAWLLLIKPRPAKSAKESSRA